MGGPESPTELQSQAGVQPFQGSTVIFCKDWAQAHARQTQNIPAAHNKASYADTLLLTVCEEGGAE